MKLVIKDGQNYQVRVKWILVLLFKEIFISNFINEPDEFLQ